LVKHANGTLAHKFGGRKMRPPSSLQAAVHPFHNFKQYSLLAVCATGEQGYVFILAISGRAAEKCSNLSFWSPLWPISGARPENAQIEASGTHFGYFWGQGWKMFQLRLLGFILAISRAWAGKCSN